MNLHILFIHQGLLSANDVILSFTQIGIPIVIWQVDPRRISMFTSVSIYIVCSGVQRRHAQNDSDDAVRMPIFWFANNIRGRAGGLENVTNCLHIRPISTRNDIGRRLTHASKNRSMTWLTFRFEFAVLSGMNNPPFFYLCESIANE